ncbi:MAG: VWA domain-containing protein [Blastocatellia bacterium]|nr:VWA domain-containing protein [Blastocatellia bacterium]
MFPKEAVEVIERHALDRYKLTELVTDAEVLQKLEPSMELLQTILTFRGLMKEKDVLEAARKIVKQVVEQLKKRFESEIRRTLWGRANRMRHSPAKVTQNFDWRKTIKRNLKNYSLEKKVLVAEKLSFFSRIEQRLPWHIIISVDQSGSMAESVIHSAVMASILSSLPSLGIKLLVFDTSIVDLSQHIDDPVEVLMSVQLGGGTDISQAVKYCETLINNPHRTIFVLISDFCEGGSVKELLATVSRLSQSGVKLLGLAALNETSIPSYDGTMARRLSEVGMEIAALTPMRFAEWLAKAIS